MMGLMEKRQSLNRLMEDISGVQLLIQEKEKVLKLENDVNDILELKDKRNMLVNDREELRKLFITIKGYNTQLERKGSEIALFEAKLKKRWEVYVCYADNQ